MAFSRLFYHIVFSTHMRQPTINPAHERQLYAYIVKVSESMGVKVIRINSMPGHIHILVQTDTDFILRDYVRDIKRSSNRMMKRTPGFEKFNGWNETYAADTVSFHHVPTVKNYIRNQKEHHDLEKYEDEIMRIFGISAEELDNAKSR